MYTFPVFLKWALSFFQNPPTPHHSVPQVLIWSFPYDLMIVLQAREDTYQVFGTFPYIALTYTPDDR